MNITRNAETGNNTKTLYIIGASGHGTVVAEIAELIGYTDIIFCDDDHAKHGTAVLQYPVAGDRSIIPGGTHVAIGIGINSVRQQLVEHAAENGWHLPVICHPGAVLSRSAEIYDGAVIMACAAVNARSVIGRGAVLNTSCSVDHDCRLGECSHIAPGAHLSGNVTVGDLSTVGIGSCVKQNISIGANVVLGAGSVVVKDVPDNVVAFGNPARVIERND